jgi:hypothetical protein
MKKIIVAVIIMVLIPISYAGAEDKQTVDPAKDKTVTSWKGYVVPPEYKYYFYKEGMTVESENKDFSECMMKSLRKPIGVGTYASKQRQVFWGQKDPIYEFIKIYMHLGICMEDRGYVIKEHSMIPEPDPDFPDD